MIYRGHKLVTSVLYPLQQASLFFEPYCQRRLPASNGEPASPHITAVARSQSSSVAVCVCVSLLLALCRGMGRCGLHAGGTYSLGGLVFFSGGDEKHDLRGTGEGVDHVRARAQRATKGRSD